MAQICTDCKKKSGPKKRFDVTGHEQCKGKCNTARGGGGGLCQVKFAVVNFATGNLAEAPGFCVANFVDTPGSVVVRRALQAHRNLATGANLAEDPGFVWEISRQI